MSDLLCVPRPHDLSDWLAWVVAWAVLGLAWSAGRATTDVLRRWASKRRQRRSKLSSGEPRAVWDDELGTWFTITRGQRRGRPGNSE